MEIKKCPFCGGTARIRECKDVEFLIHRADCYMYQCDGCGCGTSYEPTKADAIASWNRRVTDNQEQIRVSEREKIEKYINALEETIYQMAPDIVLPRR